MSHLLYRIIYQPQINFVLRNINRIFRGVLPGITLPPTGLVKYKVKGKTMWLRTNQSSYVTYLIYWNGVLSFEYSPIFVELIKDIKCYYDVGANLGYYSLLAAMFNPDVRVKSFEPSPAILRFLNENVKLNNLSKNITVESLALSNSNGETSFYEVHNPKYSYLKYHLAGESNLTGQSNKGSRRQNKDYFPYPVTIQTLDTYTSEHPDDFPGLIKMDTEGTEYTILEKGTETLLKYKPIVICEILFQVIEDKLEAIMKPLGFEFYFHTPEGLRKVDTLIRDTDDKVRDCFFVHPEKRSLIERFIVA